MPWPGKLTPEQEHAHDPSELAVPSAGIASPSALRAALLDPALWRESLQTYAHATRLAVALTNAHGDLLGECLNLQPTWHLMRTQTTVLAPPVPRGCPFSLAPSQPCTCIVAALAEGRVVFARDRTQLVHFAVPLILDDQPLGAVLAGQVFDQYPEQMVLEHVAKHRGLSPARVWQQARLETPVKQTTLHVYAELLENLSYMFLQTRYHVMQQEERLAEMTRLRDQAEQARHDATRAEEALHQANAELEQRVAERTADLLQAHGELRHQMAEQQRMQEALLQREKLAALGTLLANVAHELNNPLAVAAMQLDNLHEARRVGPWTADLDMEILREAVDRCTNVVQSFLALARQQPPTRRAIALNTVVHDALVLLQHALEVDGITVQLDLAADLPQLWGDVHQLQHVVVNLLTNAQHALRQMMPPRQLRLTTLAKAEQTQAILEVADTGPGIPEEVQHRLFEPFFTTKPQGEGSGLGLSLCRSIVQGHGGTIHVASQSGQGTTVCITLPVTVPEAQSPESAPAPAAPAQAERASILLIDDEAAIHRALIPLLQRSGHDITSAANGQEGLDALAERSYEVILCDMRMPDLDGAGFYRELERYHPHLLPRVVFLTGDVLSTEARDFFAQVDNLRLEKPFKATAVRQVIQQVLKT